MNAFTHFVVAIHAERLGWNVVRLDGRTIPDWFEPKDDQIAFFYTPPHAFEIAAQVSWTLLGCDADWILGLPPEFVRRQIRQMSLKAALELPGRAFVKHAVAKAFPAAVYDARSLAEVAVKVMPGALVQVAEIVEWSVEYRCFVRDQNVVTLSPYRRHGKVIEGHVGLLDAPHSEIATAKQFADSVLRNLLVASPPAFVLDVGSIQDRGWAVVECNECWASGIYACDPDQVLATLLRACVPTDRMTDEERRWDFQRTYHHACP